MKDKSRHFKIKESRILTKRSFLNRKEIINEGNLEGNKIVFHKNMSKNRGLSFFEFSKLCLTVETKMLKVVINVYKSNV